MIKSLYCNTGSDPATSCPIKCDVVQEIHNLRQTFNQETIALRQLVNQESSLRMGLDTQLQDLWKTVTDSLTGRGTSVTYLITKYEVVLFQCFLLIWT